MKFEASNITTNTDAGDTTVELSSRQTLNDELAKEEEDGVHNRYRWDPENKPAAGAEQKEKEISADEIYKIVEGEINFGLVMSKDDFDYINKHFPNPGTIGYSANLSRTYPAETLTISEPSEPSSEAMGSYHPILSFGSEPTEDGSDYVSYDHLDPEDGSKYDTYYLPKGKYSFAGSGDATTLPIKFSEKIEAIEIDNTKHASLFERMQNSVEVKIPAEFLADNKAIYNSDDTITLGGDGTTAGDITKRIGLARIRATVEKGTLTVTKTLQDVDSSTAGEEFSFKLSNIKYNGVPLADDTFMCQKTGDPAPIAVNLEGYSFILKSGESIVFMDLPAGLTYTVTEDSKDGFIQVSASEASGEIPANGNITASFINREKFTIKATINGSKEMTGDRRELDETRDIYSFTLEAKDGAPMPDGVVGNTMTVYNTVNGKKESDSVASSVIPFGEITYEAPKEYVYTIVETSSDDKGVTVDKKTYTVTVTVEEDTEAPKTGMLKVKSVQYSYRDGEISGSASSAAFSNEYRYKPVTGDYDFNISKTLIGPVDANAVLSKTFSFKVSRTNAPESVEGHEVSTFTDKIVQVDATKKSGDNYTGNKDDKITDTFNVPGTYIYTISEISEPKQEGMDYSGNIYTLTVDVIDDKDGNLKVNEATWAKAGGGDIISEGDAATLEFSNTYEPKPTSVNIPISKSFERGSFIGSVDFTFKAELETYNEDADKTGIDASLYSKEATISLTGETGSGNISIEGFKLAGEYVYKVTEVQTTASSIPGEIEYDGSTYTVTVTVADENGVLSASVTKIEKQGEAPAQVHESAAFANTYNPINPTPTPKFGDLTISKSVVDSDNSPLTEGIFTFTVQLADTSFNGRILDENDNVYLFESGKTTVDVGGGSSVTLKNLPIGDVIVTEQFKEGYAPQNNIDEKAAVITDAAAAAVEFVNVKDEVIPGHPKITIVKSQIRGADSDDLINVNPGDVVVYSLLVKNIGNANAENVIVTDIIPNGLIFVPGSITSEGTIGADNKTITWILGTLEAGNDRTISFSITVPDMVELKTWKNIATVSFDDPNSPDPDTPIDSNEVTISYEPERGSLTVSKTVTGNASSTADRFSFTVTLYNGLDVATEINGIYGDMMFTNGVATVILSGTQSARAERIPTGLKYTVVENGQVDVNGLPISTSYTVTSPLGGTLSGDITATGSSADFVNSNTLPLPPTGNLKVSKTITGNAANLADKFLFTVTLYNNGIVASEINGEYGEITFNAGVATLVLTSGESKVAKNLPEGISYTVSEIGEIDEAGNLIPDGVGLTGYRSTFADDGNGVIKKDVTANVSFTNIKAIGKLTVSKTVSPVNEQGLFTFTVMLYNGLDVATEINGIYGDMTFTNGVATVILTGGDSKTATNLPAGLNYTVSEEIYSDYNQYVGDANGTPSTNNITARGIIPEGDDPAVAAFTNIKIETPQPKGNLEITKNVIGDYSGETFTFSVTLYYGTTIANDINGTYGDMSFIGGVATVYLKHGEKKTAVGLPAGIGYTVAETDSQGYNSDFGEAATINLFSEYNPFMLLDATVSSKSGTIAADSTESVVCNNRKPAQTSGDLKITKIVTNLDSQILTEGIFAFDVQLADFSYNGTILDEHGRSYPFTNGKTTVYVDGGSSVTLKNLPTGEVTVTELPVEGYTAKNNETVKSGIIKNGTETEVMFTNIKSGHPEVTIVKSQTSGAVKGDVLNVKAGNTVVYSLLVKNSGNANAENVIVTDVIPDGLIFVPDSITNEGTIGADNKTITWILGTLEAGDERTISFSVIIPSVAEHTEWTNIGAVVYTDPFDSIKPNDSIESNEVKVDTDPVPDPDLPEAKTGKLSLRKVVVNQSGTQISDGTAFTFDLELVGSDFTGTLSGVTFTDGRGTVEVVAGQKLVIDGLPDGTEYVITERFTAGYQLRSDISYGMTGYISESTEAEACIYNMISTVNPPVIPPTIPPVTPPKEPEDSSEVLVETPTEPNLVDEVKEADNPATGLGLAPMIGAAVAVIAVVTKRRKN